MKNMNLDLENSLLVYTRAAFIVKIIIAEFHIAWIKMAIVEAITLTE